MATAIRAIRPDESRSFDGPWAWSRIRSPGREQSRSAPPPTRPHPLWIRWREMVSTSGAYSLEMTVPGGKVACGGTTAVVVAPTHRRQGVLRQMMRAHLDDVKEHGSRSPPCGHPTVASTGASVRVRLDLLRHPNRTRRRDTQPSRPAARAGSHDRSSRGARGRPALYDRLRMEIPGFFARSRQWWDDRSFWDSESTSDTTKLRFAVVDGEDGPAGFASFRTKAHWEEGHGSGKVIIQDLFAGTPEAWAGIWSMVANQDLVARSSPGSDHPGTHIRPARRDAESPDVSI